ncbi:MAG: hypothetical protein ACHREM_30065 [Polyangiales bacterium]
MFRSSFALFSALFATLVAGPARAQVTGDITDVPFGSSSDDSLPRAIHHATREPAYASFGAQGQIVLTAGAGGSNGAGFGRSSFDSGAHFESEAIDIGLDVFVVRGVSLGFDLSASAYDDVAFDSASHLVETKGHAFGGGLRVGFDLPIAEGVSWYPRVSFGMQAMTASELPTSASPLVTASHVGAWVHAFAPLLVHLAPHFFLGVGPAYSKRAGGWDGAPSLASADAWYGVEALLGGAWGGAPDVPAREPGVAGAGVARFGDDGSYVVDTDASASITSTSHPLVGTSSLDWSVSPGVDYFVGGGVSLGVAVTVSGHHADVVDPVAGPSAQDWKGLALGGRVGVDLRLAEGVSLYPRAHLLVGGSSTSQPYGASSNYVSVLLEAPLLFHVATHFFVGAGPYARRDLARDTTYASGGTVANLSASYGLSSLIGGWL